MYVLYVICDVPIFRGFSSGRGNFETTPHIDTWTNEKTVNGDKDVSIGGMHFMGIGKIGLKCNRLKWY